MAKFKKGDKKPENSGRKKGTPNKSNLGVAEFLKDRNFNVLERAIEVFEDTEKEEIKVSILKELLKYIYPQRKAVEFETNSMENMQITINRKAVEVEK